MENRNQKERQGTDKDTKIGEETRKRQETRENRKENKENKQYKRGGTRAEEDIRR